MTGYGSGPYGSGPYGGDTTPGGLPTVHVLLDDGTGTFPYDLTNMSGVSYVLLPEGFKHDHGRQDWQGGVTAGSLSLTLNNADGRFTPGSTIIASPSPIKVDQRIRITETVNGTTFTRFTGYVKQWPVAWPATVTTWATVQVMATDAQARAERRVLRSALADEMDLDNPTALFTLADAEGSKSAQDTSGNQFPPAVMVAPSGSGPFSDVVFGVAGLPSDGLTAAQFAGTSGLYLQTSVTVPATAQRSVEVWFSTTSTNPSIAQIAGSGIGLFYDGSTGKLKGSGGLVSARTVNDGAFHQAIITYNGTTNVLYLDGVSVASGAGSAIPNAQLVIGSLFAGTIGRVVVHPTALSSDRVAARYAAGAGSVQSGTTRIASIASYANLPIGTFDTSLTNVAFTDFAGRSAWEAIQQVADAEGGVAYFDGSGNLTFHNRNRVTVKTAPDLTMDKSYVTPDVQPVHDDQQIVNYIEAMAEGTQVAQVARNTASEDLHGRYSDSKTYLVQTDAEALDRANWILSNFAEPTTRYGTLTVNLYAMPAATAALTLDALEIGAWLQITDMPSQNTGGATVDLVVEGYSEQVTASSWTVTLNVVSKALTDAFILDDPVRGVLDAGNRLYV